MTVKSKKALLILLLAGCILVGYIFWLSLRPVEIVAVHQSNNNSAVLVRNFPFTDKGKIDWWLKNKSMLKNRYGIPKPESDGFFVIVFWDFGDGYKEEGKYDRRCFDDMKTEVNCIDKNSLMMVRNSKNTGMYFILESGKYRIRENGEIIKNRSE